MASRSQHLRDLDGHTPLLRPDTRRPHDAQQVLHRLANVGVAAVTDPKDEPRQGGRACLLRVLRFLEEVPRECLGRHPLL
jgi:hypothetical protein